MKSNKDINFIELQKNWDYKKNTNVDINSVTLGSGKKVWWKCPICNFEWNRSIYYMVKSGYICPSCEAKKGKGHLLIYGVNDLYTWCKANNRMDILKEWDYKSNNVSPKECTYGSSKIVWWTCKNGHHYNQRINHKTGIESCECPYCKNVKVLYGYNDLYTWCKTNNRMDILEEWDYSKNDAKPTEILYTATKKYNFICKHGHSFQREIYDRTLNFAHCPTCQKSNKTSIKEKTVYYYLKKYFNDTVENYSDKSLMGKEIDIFIPSMKVGVEYDGQFYHQNYERDIKKNILCKNLNIKLYRIRESKLDVLKFCHNIKLKNETTKSLEQAIMSLLKELKVKDADININRDSIDIQNLMIKYNVDNSFYELCIKNHKKQILSEWDYEKNGMITPQNISYGSTQKYYFTCKNGHSYKQSPASKANGRECPYCKNRKVESGFNDLVTWCKQNQLDYLLEEWDYEKNEITPSEISHGSTKKVFWKCSNNHSFVQSPNARTGTRKRNCPYCAGRMILKGFNDLVTWCNNNKRNDILKEWDYERNMQEQPEDYLAKSSKKVWWICSKCNCSWQTRISHRTDGHNCPRCSKKRNSI